jgi:hypothetical protein
MVILGVDKETRPILAKLNEADCGVGFTVVE